MLYLIQDDLSKMNIQIGRDRFFALLRKHNLLVNRKKRIVFTTDSRHPFQVYGNLIAEKTVDNILQVVVADITYIRTLEGFVYLALLTDSFSRKILGWNVNNSLELEGCLAALKMMLSSISKVKHSLSTIHHSDRGSQYCSHAYTQLLKENQIQISMASAGNCYENAQAERVNGILKSEFELYQTFNSKTTAHKAVANAIQLYNQKRPHLMLNFKTPNEVFLTNFNELFCFLRL